MSEDELLSFCRSVSVCKDEITNNINKLKKVFTTVDSSWDSDTKIAFRTIFDNITKNMDVLMQQLHEQGINIEKYVNDIRSTEEKYTSRLR